MPELAFGIGAYDNTSYGIPPVILENWLVEKAPDRADKQVRLVPTPGASTFSDLSVSGRGLFQSDGVISGDLIAVHGTAVVRIDSAGTPTTITGAVAAGTDQAIMAASQTPELVLNVGGTVYTVTSSAVTSFTWAGLSGANISDVIEINQRHLYLEDGTGRVWYSDRADATTVGGTSFVTAENEPDRLIALMESGNTLIFFGSKTYELWYDTGDATVPLAPRPGSAVAMGIIGREAKAQINGVPYFVRSDGAVCRLDGFRANVISTDPIATMITDLSDANQMLVSLTGYSQAGKEFLQLSLPGLGDWFYDNTTGFWHRRRDLGLGTYSYRFYERAFGKLLGQATSDGDVVTLSPTVYTDRGTEARRVATGLMVLPDDNFRLNNLIIEGQAGVGLDGSGQGSDPQGMLRIARDGRTFEEEYTRSLGKLGEYKRRAVYGPLGMLTPPMALFEFAVSDPIGYSVYGVRINARRP